MYFNTEKQNEKQKQKDRFQEEVKQIKNVPGFCDSASNGRAGTDCLKKIKQRNVKISATYQKYHRKTMQNKTSWTCINRPLYIK